MPRWTKSQEAPARSIRWAKSASDQTVLPPPPVTKEVQRPQRSATCRSYILQHYHSTGCAGGAFSWRAVMLDPKKTMFMCMEPRDYRSTSAHDIQVSKDDKRRGGGPRVGSFQQCIPGDGWKALPKYDYTTDKRSCGYNERMHVEWENHVDHILCNGGELPIASVVAKAGFRSCAPCCRDMLALARPTGKTFIMVDLAEDDTRGTFHFVVGDNYLPVPKEACTMDEIRALKDVVTKAQANGYESSEAIAEAVLALQPPIDKTAQALYVGDEALLPSGCARNLKGMPLIQALHAEHFARLLAEYGASVLRDSTSTHDQQVAVRECRDLAKKKLIDAWRPHLAGIEVDLERYAVAAITPLFPESPLEYQTLRRSVRIPTSVQDQNTKSIETRKLSLQRGDATKHSLEDDDCESSIGASTTVPDDTISTWSEPDDPETL